MSKNLWSHEVEETSRANAIPKGLFTKSAKEIAEGLKKVVAEHPDKNRSNLDTAMSMLDFYINRAGDNLSGDDKKRLNQAKDELDKLYNR